MTLQKLFIVSLSIVFSSCAPGLGLIMRIDRFAPVSEASDSPSLSIAPVRIVQVFDDRKTRVVARIDGREVSQDSDIEQPLRVEFQALLRSAGIPVAQFEGIPIALRVESWRVLVTPGFPTTSIVADAEVRVSVYDREEAEPITETSKPKVSIRYSGKVESKRPVAGSEYIEEQLAQAMSEALTAAVNDSALRNYL